MVKCSICKVNEGNSSNRYLCIKCKKNYDKDYCLKNKEKRREDYIKKTEGKVKRRKIWNLCPENKDFYMKQYIFFNKTPKQISKEFNISSKAVFNRIKIFNIKKDKSKINLGEQNGKWVGDNINYYALHIWIRKYKPLEEFCEICGGKDKLELANISGEYKRDVNDFQWLCIRCHVYKDGTVNNLNFNRNKLKSIKLKEV